MKLVVDSSVGLKWVLAEVDSARAVRLRDEFGKGIHELIAPDVFMPEVANGLASAERQGRFLQNEAVASLLDIALTSPAIHLSLPHLTRAVEVSIDSKQAVYDCIYLALAEFEQCEMVTADDVFYRKMHGNFPFLIRLIDLP